MGQQIARLAILLIAVSGLLPSAHAEVVPTWDDINQRLSTLKESEGDITRAYDNLPAEVRDPSLFVKRVQGILAPLSEEQITELHKTINLAKKRDTLPPAAQTALTEVEAYDGKLKAFQAQYDAYNLERIRYFSDLYQRIGEDLVAKAKLQNISSSQAAKLDKQIAEMREEHTRFAERLAKGGFDEDKTWMGAFQSQHSKLLALAGDSGKEIRTFKESLQHVYNKVKSFLSFAVPMTAGITAAPKMPFLWLLRKPIISGTSSASGNVVRALGLNLKIEGQENIPTPPKGGANVYTLNHTTSTHLGILDGHTLGRMIGSNPALVDGGMGSLPLVGPFLGELEKTNPNHIVVGGKPDPVTQFADRISRSPDDKLYADSLFVFPEGNTFDGNVYGLRPWQRHFGLGVLDNLRRRKGVPVQIVPVSSPGHYRFWNNAGLNPDDPKDLKTYIHEPIPAEVTTMLLGSGDQDRLGRVVRQVWLNSLDKNGVAGRRLGTPSIEKLDDLNRRNLEKKIGCNQLVADLIP